MQVVVAESAVNMCLHYQPIILVFTVAQWQKCLNMTIVAIFA